MECLLYRTTSGVAKPGPIANCIHGGNRNKQGGRVTLMWLASGPFKWPGGALMWLFDSKKKRKKKNG